MKWISEDFRDLRELYVYQLRVLLSAEEQIVRALPTMITMAGDEQLRQAFRSHVLETEAQIKRLEDLLATEKSTDPAVSSTGPVKCKAMGALITEVEEMTMDAHPGVVRDVALIAAAQRVEHYEIAAYGAVRHFARVLGESAAAEKLDQTIQEEGHADHVLTSIAERVDIEARRTAA
jgi:ferritin-like metal-binding protein YciE